MDSFISFLNDVSSLWGLIDFIPSYLRLILMAVLVTQIARSVSDIVT